jgi:prolipoprotein diacylglyceryltransferase
MYDILYNISLHVIYAKIIPNVVHDITTMIVVISFFIVFYSIARLFITTGLKADNTMLELMKMGTKHTWKVETKPDENIQKNS